LLHTRRACKIRVRLAKMEARFPPSATLSALLWRTIVRTRAKSCPGGRRGCRGRWTVCHDDLDRGWSGVGRTAEWPVLARSLALRSCARSFARSFVRQGCLPSLRALVAPSGRSGPGTSVCTRRTMTCTRSRRTLKSRLTRRPSWWSGTRRTGRAVRRCRRCRRCRR